MYFLTIFLVYLLGICLLRLLDNRWSLAEWLGFSFPIGMGTITLLMFLVDLLGIRLTGTTVLVLTILPIALLYAFMAIRRRDINLFSFLLPYLRRSTWIFLLRRQNLGVLFLLGLVVYVIYLVALKTLYWPPFHYDTVAGYDFLARAVAHEGTLHNALFDPAHRLASYRTLYPPLFPLSFAYFYLLGCSAKVVSLLFYLSLAFSFYGLLRRYTNPFLSMFAVLLLLTVPEFAAQSTFLMTNMPQAVYTLIGVLAFISWFRGKGRSFLPLSIIALTLGVWGRTEGVVFFVPCCFALAWRLWTERRQRPLFSWRNIRLCLLFGLPSCIVYVVWELYLKHVLLVADMQQPFKIGLITLEGKFDYMMQLVTEVTASTQLYGIVFLLGLVVLVLNLLNALYRRSLALLNPVPLVLMLAAWCLYLLVYYQIDVPTLAEFDGYISNGYKRGLFNFLPLVLFYVATSDVMQRLSTLFYIEYPKK